MLNFSLMGNIFRGMYQIQETTKTKLNKTKLTLVWSPLTTSAQEADYQVYSNKNHSSRFPKPARGKGYSVAHNES